MSKRKQTRKVRVVKTRTRKKKIGTWKVKRVGDNEILLRVPDGIEIQGKDLKIEDVLGAISNYLVVKKGRVLLCCHGNIAIA